jgi:hypothetical protein
MILRVKNGYDFQHTMKGQNGKTNEKPPLKKVHLCWTPDFPVAPNLAFF